MSASEDIGASTGTGSTEHLDPGRKYGWPDPSNKVNWTCNFCKKVCKGGVYRLKQHLLGAEAKNVTQIMPSVDDADDYDDVEELDPESLNTKGNGSGSVQSKKRSRVKGPLDMYVTSNSVEGEERKKRNIWSL
ncbi:Alanine racemase catabolic [Bienertia sinuspersici]